MSEHDEPKTALTRLLVAHGSHFVKSAYPSWECSCGEWDGAIADDGSETDGQQDTTEGHAAHLADVLLAEGYTTTPAPEAVETVKWGVDYGYANGHIATAGHETAARRNAAAYGGTVVSRRGDGPWVPVDRGADGHEEGP